VINAEPPRTRFDVLFRLAGFSVRVHPTFWLVGVFLGIDSFRRQIDIVEVLIWVGIMFVSILVHELGHALMVRRFGWNSRIILYALGGLATVESPPSYLPEYGEDLPPKAKVAIAAAGPAAGFLLAAAAAGVLLLAPVHFGVSTHEKLGVWFEHDLDAGHFPLNTPQYEQYLKNEGQLEPRSEEYKQKLADYSTRRRLGTLIDDLLFINIIWGLFNLLPVFPLDGGQIALALMTAKNQRAGLEKALLLSVIVAAIVGGLGLLHFGFNMGGFFLALMFGMLAFINYRLLQQVRSMGDAEGPDDFSGYDPGDWWKR
jgi:Zn-dependent protease